MSPVIYALFAYALTAVVSYLVTAAIVLINYVMGRRAEHKKEQSGGRK